MGAKDIISPGVSVRAFAIIGQDSSKINRCPNNGDRSIRINP